MSRRLSSVHPQRRNVHYSQCRTQFLAFRSRLFNFWLKIKDDYYAFIPRSPLPSPLKIIHNIIRNEEIIGSSWPILKEPSHQISVKLAKHGKLFPTMVVRPRPMCPRPKILGCCIPWTKCPLSILPLTEPSHP